MEATYIGIHMWAQAVEKAKSTDTDKVIAAMAGQTFKGPDGFVITMDAKNHHLHKPVFIGEIKPDGQFNVVWKTPGPIKAQPWSPYIPEDKSKKDEPHGRWRSLPPRGRPRAARQSRIRRSLGSLLGGLSGSAGEGQLPGFDGRELETGISDVLHSDEGADRMLRIGNVHAHARLGARRGPGARDRRR